jgi:hypothetical protein
MEITTDEEFYSWARNNLREIHSFSISFEEKRKLEYSIYAVVRDYENNRLPAKKTFDLIQEKISLLEESLYKMKAAAIEGNSERAEIAKINAQIAIEHINKNLRKAEEVDFKYGKKIKNIERRIIAKEVFLEISKNMTSQI